MTSRSVPGNTLRLAVICAVSAGLLLTAAEPEHDPASMQTFQIPSQGSLLNALVYVAAGADRTQPSFCFTAFPVTSGTSI